MKRKRIADYGIRIGRLPKGPLNKISDVPGVTVGHWTLHDERRHTGVTVILPGGNVFRAAACGNFWNKKEETALRCASRGRFFTRKFSARGE